MNDDVEVIRVIKTRLLRRGKGVDSSDPVRIIEQWWDMDGNLLWSLDTWNGQVYSPRLRALDQMHGVQ